MNQQAPWWIPPPAQLSQPLVSCEARAAEQLHPPVQTPSLCSLTLISIFLAFFHVPAHKMKKEPPTNPSFSSPSLVHPFFQRLSNCCVICGTKIFLVSKMKSKSEMQLFHLVTSSAFVLSCSYCQLSFPEVTLSCEHTLEAERQTQWCEGSDFYFQ